MFWKIFVFEIQNRVRRPAVYLYFLAALVFTIGSFATGSLPVGEKEHINSPYLIGMWCAGITMMMMLISSSIMGTALYRDIEYNTKDYYLTYPITKAGYFWGRFWGSFLFMILISSSIIIGIYFGSKLGPAMGWKDPKQYGPNKLIYFLQPYFGIALPNLFFTSALFFGLVALMRNVKVIYSGGILLFLGYFLSIFFLNHTNNVNVINLADPFALNGIRLQSSIATSVQQNTTMLNISGTFLINRILWSAVGLIILLYTYLRFNFERFFSGKRDKAAIDDEFSKVNRTNIKPAKTSFTGRYNRSTLYHLVKMELTNIVRDNYFWIIVSSGLVFLAFVFWMGNHDNGVPQFPRTVMFLDIFNDAFPFFIFFIIIFYTGETLHRDRFTRFAFINDSLPPPNWVLNGSKLITLLILGACLSVIPIILGIPIQLLKGFHQLNIPGYFTFMLAYLLPSLLEMVLFSYLVHVIVNNKFVAHGIGVSIWVAVFFLHITGIFNYNLLLYSYTPFHGLSDMDGIGHMAKPVYWFNLYWLLCGALFIIISALFFYRGVTSSFKERLQLLGERFDTKTRAFAAVLLIAFLAVGGYIYYNVSYLNNFLTQGESEDRAIAYEKQLKHFDSLPLPKVTRITMFADLYPDKQQEYVKAFITILNKTNKPITTMLLDGDDLSDYRLKCNGQSIPFTYPLFYSRGMLNLFRPKTDTAEFRLYRLRKPLAPGDTLVLELNSSVIHRGFTNGMFASNLLRNGTFFTGGLPGLGYDDDDEIHSPYVRRKNGLPVKKDEEVAQDDPEGIATLKAGKESDLLSMDITVSTVAGQTALAPGKLQKQWQQYGRSYFHYVQNKPGMYAPFAVISAKYAVLHDTVMLDHPVNINIYYHPAHAANIGRFMAAYKDGLRYFSKAYGNYPFDDIRLAETSNYSPGVASLTTLDGFNENYFWNAGFDDPNEFDYCYFNAARQLSQQWWRFQVAPNNTVGSLTIPEGIATYDALILAEKMYGKSNMRNVLQNQLWQYLNIRHRMEEKEHPIIKANLWFEWGGKAGVALYGLRDLIGDDSINTALREFKKEYAFRNKAPFAGSRDLYRYLQKHVPDSLQYYLTDTWQKITLYDNKITEVKAVPTGKNNDYKVTLTVDAAKVYIDDKGNDVPALKMNDYIDIGIFGHDSANKDGRMHTNPLYFKKYKLSYGKHTITVTVKGKPAFVGIDPYNKLIDRMANDNLKNI